VLYTGDKHGLSPYEKNTVRGSLISVLKRIFGPKREEVMGGWWKLHNPYTSQNIITKMKSRRMRWTGNTA